MGDDNDDGLCITDVTVTSDYANDPTDTIHVNDVLTYDDGFWLDSTDCVSNDNNCKQSLKWFEP